MSKVRCDGDQVHSFYFAMKDLFGREYERRRYVRHDVNISFMTDGRDLFSGYTLMYGGFDNGGTYLLRGRQVVAHSPEARFPPFVDIDDLHLFWRRLQVSYVDGRIRAALDDAEIIDYVDPAPPRGSPGGYVTLWTRRNGIVCARLNSSAERVVRAAAPALQVHAGAAPVESHWRPLAAGRVQLGPGGDGRVRAVNAFSGGTFALEYALPDPVALQETPILSLPLQIPAGSKVNLHLTVSGMPFIYPLTAPQSATYRVLGPSLPTGWLLYAAPSLSLPFVTSEKAAVAAAAVTIDLRRLMNDRFPNVDTLQLERLIIGNTSHHRYLLAGLSGNAAGAWYEVGEPVFGPPPE
jgi:hypothetical protein